MRPSRFFYRRAEEMQTVRAFLQRGNRALLSTGEMGGFPAQTPLFTQNGGGAEGITAVQRQGVVENADDAHNCRIDKIDECQNQFYTVLFAGLRPLSQKPSQDKSSVDRLRNGVARWAWMVSTTDGSRRCVASVWTSIKPLCVASDR